MIKLAFIAPTCALEEISTLGDIEFCLAPYCKDPKYKQYFIDQKKKGRFIIMDNGVAEDNLISNEELVELAIEMKVDELIIPDEIGNYEKTTKMKEKFLEDYYNILQLNGIKLQSVIQGEIIYDYIKAILDLEEDDRIDVIGIPFRINYCQFNDTTKEENRTWNRLMFLDYVNIDKPIHLLGNNLPCELLWSINSNVRSCDSKLMARYGFNNQFWNFDDKVKPQKKLFMDSMMTDKQIEIGVRNIKMLKRELG